MRDHSMVSFICLFSKGSTESVFGKCNFGLTTCITLFCFCVIAQVPSASAQVVLFDFDNAPLHSSLPIDQTVSGITAHLSATGQGYSIQDANVLGFTPPGFAGHIIYPNSIYLADLLIHFDQVLTDLSIMYSVQELACDTSATMRVTAYMNSNFVGTNKKVANYPGTWPVDTLKCSFSQGFDNVVIHFDSHPPTCQDWGPIFMADNMQVIPSDVTTSLNVNLASGWNLISNPVTNPVRGDSVRQLYPMSSNAHAYEFSGGYVQRYRMENGKGYWEKFPGATTNTITGTARTQDSISVVAGWNIIGSISHPADTASIVQIPIGIVASPYYGYNGSYTVTDTIKPGAGYWVKINQNGKLVLH